jgi:DNA polymerase III sliding clamp (beta) subunit (PCNA family)
MTDFSIQLNTNILRAALICTSDEEVRYYLQGVSIEPNPRDLRVVSTDGHRLFCARIDVVVDVDKFLIPKDALARALKGYKHTHLYISREGNLWRAGDVVFTPIDGVFPDSWPRVIPQDPPATLTAAQFNPANLADMKKVAEALDGKGSVASIYADGENPALVTFGAREDCCAVVMPMRNNAFNLLGPQARRSLVHSLITIPTTA